jgi:5-methylcytosine-specific restriction endonuclease McrA
MEKPTLKSAKTKLWKTFSEYVRRSENGICFTCGKKDDYRNVDAGHYVPRSAGLSLYFDPRNVHVQCVGCNRFRHGNLQAYAIALRDKYGPNILEELDAKRREIKKYSVPEYQALIEEYKEKLKDLVT